MSSKCDCYVHHSTNETIASMTKIITSHFAISIEKPAIPRAPNTYAINANTKKVTASPIKPGMFHPSIGT